MSDLEIFLWMIWLAGWVIVMIIMRKEGTLYAYFSGGVWPLLVILALPFWLFSASKRLRNILGW